MTRFSAILAGAAVAASGIAMPAYAQSASETRESHFDGPYVQAFGGLATRSNDGGESIVFDTDGDGSFNDSVNTTSGADAFSPGFCNGLANGSTPGEGCRGDKDGAEYGVRLGYDKRMGNFVIGGLLEGSMSEARDGVTGFSTTPASYAIEREMDYAVSGRVRAGFTPGGGALFYVTGGGGIAKFDHEFITTNGANSFTPRNDNKVAWGWQAGGGAEVMVTSKVSLGLEYLYSRYDDNDYDVVVGQGSAPGTNPFLLDSGSTTLRGSDTDFSQHSLRATIGYRF